MYLLEEIFAQYGIALKNSDGEFRNVVDVIEDMYIKLNTSEIARIMMEISEEEKYSNIFDSLRGRKYRGEE